MKRALLIGSQTAGLSAVHADIEAMDDALRRLGFTTIPSTGAAATADEIVARYRGLIEDTAPDDTALVYYSGHGARQPNPLAGTESDVPTWLQYIVPTDYDNRSGGRARCVLAEELSALQAELSQKARNVVTVLDCCHSARMSRGELAVPKAFDQLVLPTDDLMRRWQALSATATLEADANPNAVRLVACGPEQSAYEDYVPELKRRHGLLTGALVRLLTSPEALAITWADALEVIRTSLPAITPQRPDVEGPAERLLFSLRTRTRRGVLPVRLVAGRPILPDVVIFGVTVGDTYDLLPPGVESPVGRAVVERFEGEHGVLRLTGITTSDLPPGTSAWPVEYALPLRDIAVVPVSHPQRDLVVAEFDRVKRVQPVSEQVGVLATVQLDGDALQALDAAGQPLYPVPVPATKESITTVVADVTTLAVADHVRNLQASTAMLPDDVDLHYSRMSADGTTTELTPGEHLFTGDLLRVQITNNGSETRYVSVFDIGLAGAVTQLTVSEPGGVTLAPGESYDLGPQWRDGGLPLIWPASLPGVDPRLESFVTVVADRRVDRLSSLGQPGVVRGAGANDLERVVADIATGRRDVPPPRTSPGIRWAVKRFDFLLHPAPRPSTAGEPRFEIDERPDTSFRFVTPRGTTPPRRVAVRLKNVVVHSNRAFLRAKVRVDFMVITAVGEHEGSPYRASTMRFDRVKDGDQLPFDDVLVYDGPVARFLDIALWVAKDDSADVDLATQLSTKLADQEVSEAITTLAALSLAAPAAAAVAASAAAVAVLIRTAAQLIDQARGSSIGVYRTTLLPHQRFGIADRIGRHPAQGLLRAQDMSFAFEVIDLDADEP